MGRTNVYIVEDNSEDCGECIWLLLKLTGYLLIIALVLVILPFYLIYLLIVYCNNKKKNEQQHTAVAPHTRVISYFRGEPVGVTNVQPAGGHVQTVQTIQTIQPVQTMQTIQPMQTVQTVQPVQTMHTVQYV